MRICRPPLSSTLFQKDEVRYHIPIPSPFEEEDFGEPFRFRAVGPLQGMLPQHSPARAHQAGLHLPFHKVRDGPLARRTSVSTSACASEASGARRRKIPCNRMLNKKERGSRLVPRLFIVIDTAHYFLHQTNFLSLPHLLFLLGRNRLPLVPQNLLLKFQQNQ